MKEGFSFLGVLAYTRELFSKKLRRGIGGRSGIVGPAPVRVHCFQYHVGRSSLSQAAAVTVP